MKRRTFLRSSLGAVAAASIPFPRRLEAAYRPAPRVPEDLQAITGDGREITLTSEAIADLAGRLKGRVLMAGDDGYDGARRILNPSFDKRPALIAQVTGTADVREAVDFARENEGLLLAVKCGGHSFSGKSTCDMGMMIDLSPFRNVRVDPIAQRARVTGGSLLGQLDHEAMAYDLVTPMGTVSHTGVGGLVTGGGFGRLARRFGLSVDNLLSADVVAADGDFYRASEDENPDLFWGVRGGGGNFGVVTSFEFRLHPMQRRVLAGRIMFPIEMVREVLTFYGEYGPEAPDELQLDCAVVIPPGGAPGVAGFGVCYSGPASQAERVLAPIRKLGTPLVDNVEGMDYVALQRSGDTEDFRAQAAYLKSGFVTDIPADLVTAIADGIEGHPGRLTQLIFVQGGGAIGRIPNEATAFSQRDKFANLLTIVGWPYPTDGSEHIEWIRQFWPAIEPFTRGFYTNDLEGGITTEVINANYRGNFNRLVAVKNRYDPSNLFRLNANVEPSV
ncbi:MAG: FAD-binding oxidoreductase [Gemmatimonadota bacterium]|nr:MAG: FAD-binding oxidoreductase [Gemmatimonadota bacterium]